MDHQRLTKIADYVYNTAVPEYQGLPICIKHYKNLIFVGIHQSLVRVFDTATDTEMKPLINTKSNREKINRVTCMDISLNGEHIIVGYAEGNLALFDLLKQKLIIEITDVHYKKIENVKFLSIDSPISIVSGDEKGRLFKISITRTFLIYSYKKELIMKKDFTEFTSLAALQPISGMPYEVSEWHIHNIVAFANTEEINVAVLGSNARKLYSISRSEFGKGSVEQGNLCYLDWGYGITPQVSREKSKWLLAIAWGKVVQIMILEDPDKGMSGIRGDGYYISDSSIDCIYFMSDSILMILVNKKEVRILYIPHFLPGTFWYEGNKVKEAEDSKTKNQKAGKKIGSKYKLSSGEIHLRECSTKAELESGTTLLDGNLRYSVTAGKSNFNHTIAKSENSLIVLGQEKILSAKLFHWEDYLNYVEKQWDWLVKLKNALDIYHGETKGYYGVPYIKEEREEALRQKMMQLIQDGIQNMIKDFGKRDKTSDGKLDYRADNIAIKAAVEFWNRINEFKFLFNAIFKIFVEEGLGDKFVEGLEPFILSGYFKDEHLPDILLKKICDHYFNNNKFFDFERIVSKLNFSHYSLFDQLETICKEKMLTTALIHLIITSTSGNDKKACSQILNNVFNRFKKAKRLKTLDEIKEMVLKDEQSKFSIEASYEYIGLKLMYIIKLFIKGEKFPSGKLTKAQSPWFLAQSLEFLMREDEAVELLKLNSRTFFKVVADLFIEEYISQKLLALNKSKNEKGEPFIEYTHMKIIDKLYDMILVLQKEDHILFEYSLFIIRIANSEWCKGDTQQIDHLSSRIYNSIKNLMDGFINLEEKSQKKKKDIMSFDQKYKYVGPENIEQKQLESEILRILPIYAAEMDDTELEELIFRANELKFDNTKILLYEQKQEFDRWVDIFLNSNRIKRTNIFTWLKTLYKRRDKQKKMSIEVLCDKISNVIEELIQTDSEETGYVIDFWLPDKQKQIINKLDKKPDLQLQYLESYLKEREEEIKEMLTAVSVNSGSKPEAKNYKEYLQKHVDLLAKKENPKLIEVVKKDYYPLDSLEKRAANSSTLIKEAQAYLKKRAGMHTQSIKMFLDLLKQIDKDTIEAEIFAQGQSIQSKTHVLNFKNIYSEVLEILREHSKQAGASMAIWTTCMKEMFYIRNKFLEAKSPAINDFIYGCISELMQIMSEYVDFQKVIDDLLNIDKEVKYAYAKEWFRGLYSSKNDQELLYTSAKKLLSNENSTLIDTIIEKNNAGFIGERDKQICAICKLNLGGFVNDCAFILTQCEHQFHSKCFFEEIKNRCIIEGKRASDMKAECLIWRENHIEFEENKKPKPALGGRRRRNRKNKGKKDDDEIEEESEEDISTHPLAEKKPIRTFDQFVSENKSMNEEVYKQRMRAFDEDFKASQLSFVVD